jgi:NADPH-dependent 7-cyano-7-deazaguanine reductase QueF
VLNPKHCLMSSTAHYLKLQSNENRCAFTEHEHGLSFHDTCPVSGNPKLGSSLTICYKAKDYFLEVASLKELVDSYRGGKGDVRSMEGMLQEIAQVCADALDVDVQLHSFLLLEPDQTMRVKCYAFPK